MQRPVTMTCMTTKKQFDVDNPPVVVLANGRYAYRVPCPWEGKNGKELYAFKFCSSEAYRRYKDTCENDVEEETDENFLEEGEIPETTR